MDLFLHCAGSGGQKVKGGVNRTVVCIWYFLWLLKMSIPRACVAVWLCGEQGCAEALERFGNTPPSGCDTQLYSTEEYES